MTQAEMKEQLEMLSPEWKEAVRQMLEEYSQPSEPLEAAITNRNQSLKEIAKHLGTIARYMPVIAGKM